MKPYVVKVKYQETLRRLRIHGACPNSLNELTSQIRELFNFPSNANLAIAYTDGDGDVVTMSEDLDVLEAYRFGPNPLRLDVSLMAPPITPPIIATLEGLRL